MWVWKCVCVFVHGAMAKFMSTLHKNENNADISFDQIYLPKLHENTLKFYRLSFSTRIALALNNLRSLIGHKSDVS